MTTIRKLENDDLLELIPLYVALCQSIEKDWPTFVAVNALIEDINRKKGFTAFGLFEDNKLVGFMTGYYFTKKQFHFSGIYVKIKNTSKLKDLIDFSLSEIKKKGYSSWSSNATNDNIRSIMQKYGAKVCYTNFLGEL